MVLAPGQFLAYKQREVQMYKIIGGDQQEYGPASANELKQWIREGRLSPHSRVLPEGTLEWRAMSELPEFAEALAEQGARTQAPGAGVPPPDPAGYSAYLLAQPAQLQVGRCFAQGWELLSANFSVLFGATFLVWLISFILQFLPLVGVFYFVIRGVLWGGLFMVYLSCLRGRSPAISEVFQGFGPPFIHLMLAGLVSAFLSWIGSMFCLLPGIFLMVAWAFCLPLAGDKRLEFWSAMEVSRKVVTRQWFQVFALLLLAFLPVILVTAYTQFKMVKELYPFVQKIMEGMSGAGAVDPLRMKEEITRLMQDLMKVVVPLTLLKQVVLLFNVPLAFAAMISAYETLFGTRPKDRP